MKRKTIVARERHQRLTALCFQDDGIINISPDACACLDIFGSDVAARILNARAFHFVAFLGNKPEHEQNEASRADQGWPEKDREADKQMFSPRM